VLYLNYTSPQMKTYLVQKKLDYVDDLRRKANESVYLDELYELFFGVSSPPELLRRFQSAISEEVEAAQKIIPREARGLRPKTITIGGDDDVADSD
tara:strand:+ start:203 stop:490 length:288 start_codon:yes stop_codon:yes gene_type:complete